MTKAMIEYQPRIAMILPTLDQIGGAERQVLLLAGELAARGWLVTVIVLSGTGGTEAPQLIRCGIAFLSLKMRKAWIDPQGWQLYFTWHRQNQPHIVHAHLPHATWFARCVRTLCPVRVLVDTIHTSNKGTPARRLLYRATSSLTNHVSCVSEAVAQTAVAARMVQKHRLSILPNGVDLPSLNDFRQISVSGSFRWIAVGRLAPVKDYPTLLRAFALLPPHATLTIAGSGPEESNLKALVLELSIADHINFVGFHSDIQPLLQSANAFVLSSQWEGLPVSVLEASAAGLPVVATDALGTREALIPNQTGFLVPVGDSRALAAAMGQIMTLSPSARKSMGDRGRKLVQEKFSMEAVTNRWESLYEQLLTSNTAPTRLAPI